MKLLSAVVLFAVTLGFLTRSVAEETHHNPAHNEGQKHEASGEHSENSKLYPQPKPDLQNGVLPGKVELVEPAFMAAVGGTSATLKWNEAADAKTYHVQVATDPNFKWLKVDDHFVKGTSMEVKDLEAGKKYYWRVAATNSEKWANSTHGYFSASSFTTK